jgi:hypothetical protein
MKNQASSTNLASTSNIARISWSSSTTGHWVRKPQVISTVKVPVPITPVFEQNTMQSNSPGSSISSSNISRPKK